jgi:hypothetical protein
MPVRHQLDATWNFDPDRVGAAVRRRADNNSKTHRRRKGRERLPVNFFRQSGSKNRFARLVRPGHTFWCFVFGLLPLPYCACSKITSLMIAPLERLDFKAIDTAQFRLGSNRGSETIGRRYRQYLRIDLLMKVAGAQETG